MLRGRKRRLPSFFIPEDYYHGSDSDEDDVGDTDVLGADYVQDDVVHQHDDQQEQDDVRADQHCQPQSFLQRAQEHPRGRRVLTVSVLTAQQTLERQQQQEHLSQALQSLRAKQQQLLVRNSKPQYQERTYNVVEEDDDIMGDRDGIDDEETYMEAAEDGTHVEAAEEGTDVEAAEEEDDEDEEEEEDKDDEEEEEEQEEDEEEEEDSYYEDNFPDEPEDEEVDEAHKDYHSILEELSRQWQLIELDHNVSKTACNQFWNIAFKFIPELMEEKDRQNISRKIPQFEQIRRKFKKNNCPEVDMEMAYKKKDTNEVTIVNCTSTPTKQFPGNLYEKLYEVATVKVS